MKRKGMTAAQRAVLARKGLLPRTGAAGTTFEQRMVLYTIDIEADREFRSTKEKPPPKNGEG